MNKFLLMVMLAASVGLTACARGDKGDQGAPGVDAPIPPVAAPALTDIETVLAAENAYRDLLPGGPQPAIVRKGLNCTFFRNITNQSLLATGVGTKLSAPSADKTLFTNLVGFNEPNVSAGTKYSFLPVDLQAVNNNYAIECTGYLVITQMGLYTFKLSSDDSALLYVSSTSSSTGTLTAPTNSSTPSLTAFDADHGMQSVYSSAMLLTPGVKWIRVVHRQNGGGNQGLVLEANGSVIPAENFYR